MSKIKLIRKRSGAIVDFNPDKITTAIDKALRSVRSEPAVNEAARISDTVTLELERLFPAEAIPGVEDVQNIVEQLLMQQGLFDVAKNYIIYRYERSQARSAKAEAIKQVTQIKLDQNQLTVIKRDGQRVAFSRDKIRHTLEYFVRGVETEIDREAIIAQCEAGLYDGITTRGIANALVLAARSFIERDPAYSQVAARLQFDLVYHDAIGAATIDYSQFDSQYRTAFTRNIQRAVSFGKLDPRLLAFDLSTLATALKPERDDLFRYLGAQTLADRYFLTDPETKLPIETPQAFWMRVAMGLAIAEVPLERNQRAIEFYELMSQLRFVPSTPTLFHAGTTMPQLSSCYITTIDDDLAHIFKCIGDNAQLAKWSGGVANDWSSLRGTGAYIKKTGVESQGVVPFLKIANDTTVAINRSGRRRGATCAYLEVWHYDFEDFLELRKNTGDERRRTHDMNTAAWVPDLFMQRVRDNGDWTLFSPDEVPNLHHCYGREFKQRYEHYEQQLVAGKIKLYKTFPAKELWKKILTMLFETGHPWITFKDPANVRSPQDHVGVIHSSNLCTEIMLNTSAEETAVCNLGSVNLAQHVNNGQLDVALLQTTVTTAMRMLDNVIDINFYPTSEGKASNLKHRPVGLGIMGFQDALYQLKLSFDTDAATRFADESMELVSYYAILASAQLAAERGAYATFRGSKWDRGILPLDTLDLLEQERGEVIPVSRGSRLDWLKVRQAIAEHGMRNSNCLAIAPTATIANIAGVYPSIEPAYKNIYVKSNMSGEFTVINQYLVDDLKALGLWNQEMLNAIKSAEGSIANIDYIPVELKTKYKETFDIEPERFIRHAASRGKWIDQSQSLNLFLRGTSGKRISDAYFLAWQLGLKTTYYLRSLAASSIESSTLKLNQQQVRSSVAHQTNDAKPVVVLEPAMAEVVNETIVVTAAMAEPLPTLQLCRIDDPNCESCQ